MFINSLEILNKALKQGNAIASYKVYNLDIAKYVIQEYNTINKPVILCFDKIILEQKRDISDIYNYVNDLLKSLNIKIPVGLCMDCSDDLQLCKSIIDTGFNFVIIDFSKQEISNSYNKIKDICSYAHTKKSFIEAKISINKDLFINDYYNEFIIRTNIDILSPIIENDNDIDYEFLSQIFKKAKIPISFNNDFNLDENKLKTVIFCGVCKINFNNQLKSFSKYNKNEIKNIIFLGNEIINNNFL